MRKKQFLLCIWLCIGSSIVFQSILVGKRCIYNHWIPALCFFLFLPSPWLAARWLQMRSTSFIKGPYDNQKCLQMLPNVSRKAKLPLFRSTAIKSDHLEWSRGSDMITCCVIWAHTVLPLFTEFSPSCLPTGNWAVLWVNAIIIGSIQQGQEYVERLPSFDRIGCVPGCELSTQSWLVLIELPSCGIPDVWDVGQGPEKCLPSASTCDQWPLRKG